MTRPADLETPISVYLKLAQVAACRLDCRTQVRFTRAWLEYDGVTLNDSQHATPHFTPLPPL